MKRKLKTRKAAAKRLKVTGSGKVRRYASGRRHLLEHKAPNKKKAKRKPLGVSDSDMKKIKSMLPGLK